MNFKNLHKFTSTLHLLYVEDDTNLRAGTVEILENFFATVSVCTNGQTGLEKYKKFFNESGKYFDIVITDINMPVMNGIDMSEQIIHLNQKQSIFVISAHNEPHYLTKLINIGIDKFLTNLYKQSNYSKLCIKNQKIFIMRNSLMNIIIS